MSNRRSGHVSAQVFEAISIVGPHAHVGVHIGTGDLHAALAHDRSLGILAGASQAQHTTASARASGDHALHRSIG